MTVQQSRQHKPWPVAPGKHETFQHTSLKAAESLSGQGCANGMVAFLEYPGLFPVSMSQTRRELRGQHLIRLLLYKRRRCGKGLEA